MSSDLLAAATVILALLVFVKPARTLAWLALRGTGNVVLLVVAELVEQRRVRNAPLARPTQDPMPPMSPAGHTWNVTMWVSHRGRTVRLTSGTITGPWPAAAEIEAETMARWTATHGYPKVGKLCARAQPVKPAMEGASR